MKRVLLSALAIAFSFCLADQLLAAAGDLDVLFDLDGKVTTDIDLSAGDTFDSVMGVAIQPDGKIVAGGFGLGDFAVVRYNSNGSLDPLFGTGGITTADFSSGNDQAWDMVLQPDGKIVAAGLTTVNGEMDFAVARFNPNGTLDPTLDQGEKYLLISETRMS